MQSKLYKIIQTHAWWGYEHVFATPSVGSADTRANVTPSVLAMQ